MRILLVEDEPSAARFIAKALREARHAVDVAMDGTRVAEQCQQNDYDAVILDVMLPGKDGLTVCRELRAAGSDVPVLMLTARDAWRRACRVSTPAPTTTSSSRSISESSWRGCAP